MSAINITLTFKREYECMGREAKGRRGKGRVAWNGTIRKVRGDKDRERKVMNVWEGMQREGEEGRRCQERDDKKSERRQGVGERYSGSSLLTEYIL